MRRRTLLKVTPVAIASFILTGGSRSRAASTFSLGPATLLFAAASLDNDPAVIVRSDGTLLMTIAPKRVRPYNLDGTPIAPFGELNDHDFEYGTTLRSVAVSGGDAIIPGQLRFGGAIVAFLYSAANQIAGSSGSLNTDEPAYVAEPIPVLLSDGNVLVTWKQPFEGEAVPDILGSAMTTSFAGSSVDQFLFRGALLAEKVVEQLGCLGLPAGGAFIAYYALRSTFFGGGGHGIVFRYIGEDYDMLGPVTGPEVAVNGFGTRKSPPGFGCCAMPDGGVFAVWQKNSALRGLLHLYRHHPDTGAGGTLKIGLKSKGSARPAAAALPDGTTLVTFADKPSRQSKKFRPYAMLINPAGTIIAARIAIGPLVPVRPRLTYALKVNDTTFLAGWLVKEQIGGKWKLYNRTIAIAAS